MPGVPDVLVAAKDVYQLILENDSVRVMEVRLKPGQKALPEDWAEHKQQERVKTEEHPVHPCDERQVEREELFRPMLNIPGKEDPRDGRHAGQQDEGHADSVSRQMVLDPQ